MAIETYHNLYSVCSLIPALFTGVMGVYLFRIPGRSRATLLLSLSFLTVAVFYTGYFLGASVYHPIGRLHRFFTVAASIGDCILWILFIHHYPRDSGFRHKKVLAVILCIPLVLLLAGFVHREITGYPWTYFHSGFSYDYLPGSLDILTAGTVLFYLLIMLGTGLYRVLTLNGTERAATLAFVLAIVISHSVPGVTNYLAKTGIMSRGAYLLSQETSSLVGFILVTMLFVNATRDRINILTKVIAISFATIMMLFQALAIIFLTEHRASFEELMRREASISSFGGFGSTPWVLRADLGDAESAVHYDGSIVPYVAEKRVIAQQLRFMSVINNLNNRPNIPRTELESLLRDAGLPGRALFGSLTTLYPMNLYSTNRILNQMRKADRYIRLVYRRQSSGTDARVPRLDAIFPDSPDEDIRFFRDRLISEIHSDIADGNAPNAALQAALTPFHPEDRGFYRSLGGHHVITFVFYADNRSGFVAYPYTGMRQFLSRPSSRMIIVMISISALMLLAFPLFFKWVLTRPLNVILAGIENVQKGQMENYIEPRSNDEIGSITDAFNMMSAMIYEAYRILEEYSINLEKMVAERTRELIHSEKMASIGRMVAGMAHEMNTPIGIAITSSTFLQTLISQLDEKSRSGALTREEFTMLKERMAESATLIHDNLTRSASMIETFKLTGGDIENEIMSTFAIADTIRAAYLAFQKRIETQSVSLITDTGDITIESYPGMFYQIFVILIGNSLTHGFTDHGGTIEITVRRTDETVRIEYRDNGRGIPSEAAGRIYDPFYTTNRAGGSTGLGLYVIYNIIVNTLGGRITLDNGSQQGVHFTIEIPLESSSALIIPEHVL